MIPYFIMVIATCEIICANPQTKTTPIRYQISRNEIAFIMFLCCLLWPITWVGGFYLVWKGEDK